MSLAVLPASTNQSATGVVLGDSWSSRVEIAAGVIAIALLVVGGWVSYGDATRAEVGQLLQFSAAVLVVLPTLIRALPGIVGAGGDAFSDQLLAIAMLGALAAGEYTTAVFVPLIMAIGHLVEQHSIQGTQAAIDGLLSLQARQATVESSGGERVVDAAAVRIGDVLVIRPGETIAADGVIQTGESSLDESSITGESTPRDATVGDAVFAGSLNLAGLLRVTVHRVGAETSLGKVAALLAAAAQSKIPLLRTLERYAEFYIPAVALLAAFVLLLTHDMQRVVTVFIVACPCAMVLASPAATVATMAVASRRGILVKNARFLDSLADADTVVFDKTGTLTHGRLELVSVHPTDATGEAALLSVAATCALGSRHPVSQAIRAVVEQRQIKPRWHATVVQELPGLGVETSQGGEQLRLGKTSWLQACGVICPAPPQHVGPLTGVALDEEFLGYLLFADPVRDEAPELVADLRSLGITRVGLLTGDRHEAAEIVAAAVGCDFMQASMLPEEKLRAVQSECERGRRVIAVGDGINDALALAAGHVGIALGARGAEIAIQSADVALMNNDLRRIAEAIRLARASRRVILQNLAIALASTSVMLILSAVGTINPIWGALLHNLGTIGVLFNSARLLRLSPSSTAAVSDLPRSLALSSSV